MVIRKQGIIVVLGMLLLVGLEYLNIPDKLGEIIFSVMPDNISSVGISIMAIFAEVISYFQYFVYMCAISIVYYKSSNKHIYIKNNIQNFIIWGLWVVIEIVIIRLFAVIGGVVESMLVYTQIYRIVRVGLTSIRFAVIIIFYNRCYKQVHTSINVNKTNQKLKLVIAGMTLCYLVFSVLFVGMETANFVENQSLYDVMASVNKIDVHDAVSNMFLVAQNILIWLLIALKYEDNRDLGENSL